MGRMLAFLKEVLDEATARWPDVTQLRAFGSWGYYVDGRIFALAYAREDRVGVKLPDTAAHRSALALPGASVWAPHGAPMSDWALLPSAMLDDRAAVGAWVLRAYELVRAAPAERTPTARPARPAAGAKTPLGTKGAASAAAKKSPAKKPAAKKPAAKRRGG